MCARTTDGVGPAISGVSGTSRAVRQVTQCPYPAQGITDSVQRRNRVQDC